MNRTLLSLATASILAMGCGRAALDQGPAAPAPPPQSAAPATASAPATTEAPAAPIDAAKPDLGGNLPAAAGAAARMPGDFVVYRFSGSFRKKPLTLAERVIARKGAILTVDFTATDGDERQELRVRFDESSATHSEVVSVATLARGVETPAGVDAYEAMMARTALSADRNDELVGTEEVTVEVGGAAVTAKKTTYRVHVGKGEATLSTIESPTFAWGDVGGEIVTAKGKVLYRAEVVEAGHDDATARAALAE